MSKRKKRGAPFFGAPRLIRLGSVKDSFHVGLNMVGTLVVALG